MAHQFQVGDRVRTRTTFGDVDAGTLGVVVSRDGGNYGNPLTDFGPEHGKLSYHPGNLEPYDGHRVFLSGPMRGYENYNFPMFDQVANTIRNDYGYDVFNPAELDRQMGWVDHKSDCLGYYHSVTLTDSFDFETAMQRDLWELELCDEILLLPGWSESEGAQRELARAIELGLDLTVWLTDDDGERIKSSADNLGSIGYHRWFDQRWLESQGYWDDETYVLASQAHIADVTGEPTDDYSQVDQELEALLREEAMIAAGYYKGMVLDDNDPFESTLVDVVATNRRKRADYALDGDPFSNFRQAAQFAGVDVQTVLDVMLGIKQARLLALAANGRDPQNESVYDSILDRAVYGVIALALANETNDKEG